MIANKKSVYMWLTFGVQLLETIQNNTEDKNKTRLFANKMAALAKKVLCAELLEDVYLAKFQEVKIFEVFRNLVLEIHLEDAPTLYELISQAKEDYEQTIARRMRDCGPVTSLSDYHLRIYSCEDISSIANNIKEEDRMKLEKHARIKVFELYD